MVDKGLSGLYPVNEIFTAQDRYECMNFLAHLYLSGNDEEIRFGNFIADAVKGKVINNYPRGVRNGIRLHRSIDTFTDRHPVVKASISRLIPKYRKFSGIVVDLYYDHFLARNWDKFSGNDLETFVQDAYKMLLNRYEELPPRSKRILPYMVSQNWLAGYRRFDVMEQVFGGMSRRAKFYSGMENAVDDLKLYYDEFREEFFGFFPDIIRHSEEFRKKLEG